MNGIVTIAAISVLAWAPWGCGPASANASASEPGKGPVSGGVAPSKGNIPDISLERVDGKGSLHLHVFARDKVVIVIFWATWCDSCKSEIVGLKSGYGGLVKEGIDVLAVSMDTPDTVSEVQAEVYKYGMPFTVVFDTESRASGSLNPTGAAPFTVVIDRDMRVAFSHEGYLPGDLDKIKKVAMDALGQ
jgi:peroxiredoxin